MFSLRMQSDLMLILLGWSVCNADSTYVASGFRASFADRLYSEGYYDFARSEYLRSLYALGDGEGRDSLYYKIGLCQRHTRDYPRARMTFDTIINDSSSLLRTDAAIQRILTSMDADQYEDAYNVSRTWAIRDGCAAFRDLELASALLLDGNTDRVRAAGEMEEATFASAVRTQILSIYDEFGVQRRKSRLAAGFLSTVVPGAGKVFAERPIDGAMSFVIVGTLGYFSLRGFRKSGTSSIRGWVYGSATVVFYLGNIYGSVLAVERYNSALDEGMRSRIQLAVRVYDN